MRIRLSIFIIVCIFGLPVAAQPRSNESNSKKIPRSALAQYIAKVNKLAPAAIKAMADIDGVHSGIYQINSYPKSKGPSPKNKKVTHREYLINRSKSYQWFRPQFLQAIANARPVARSFAQISPVPYSAVFADRQFVIFSSNLDNCLNSLKKWVYSEDQTALDNSKRSYTAAMSAFISAHDSLRDLQKPGYIPKKYVEG